MADPIIAAIDVGTGSARAGLFDTQGHLLARAEHPIAINRPQANHAEHSSEDIWQAVCTSLKAAREQAGVAGGAVAAISFDATCSLVALDEQHQPVTVSTTGEDRWNTIVWLDHRALAEAEEITAGAHHVLDYVGGVMSPEMEIPKLIWLKRHLSSSWQRFAYLFDLADFLVWRAAGSNMRSQCTLTCKWTYLAHEDPGWQTDFLRDVGLDDLLTRAALPPRAEAIGHSAGNLSPQAAEQLGLTTDCVVAVGLIDAHAGALGMLGQSLDDPATLDRHIAMIAGTSTCHMALATKPRAISGVWGPYFGAVAPDLWLNEGGQSASGALLDHILECHAQGSALGADGHQQVLARIESLQVLEGIDLFARDLHVLPDFHGNRSPLADPNALGAIFGLTLDASFDSLARLYYATAAAIAMGTRHILDAMNEAGYRIETLHLSGGHAKNPLLLALYADATGCEVVLAEEQDGVLLGTAMVAAVGAGLHADLGSAGKVMARIGKTIAPDAARRPEFDRRYHIMRLMQEQSATLRAQ